MLLLDDILDPFQSGFRFSFGTETTLVDDLCWELNSRNVLLLDLLAAFDTIDCSVLLKWLARFGTWRRYFAVVLIISGCQISVSYIGRLLLGLLTL